MSAFQDKIARFDKASRQWRVVNDDGTVVQDGFESEAAAQKWIDDHSGASPPIGHNMPSPIVPEPIFPDQLLWPEEVAAELGVKPETLAAWRSLGKGPPYLKAGRFVRYPRPNYVRWLKTRLQQPMTAQSRRADTIA